MCMATCLVAHGPALSAVGVPSIDKKPCQMGQTYIEASLSHVSNIGPYNGHCLVVHKLVGSS